MKKIISKIKEDLKLTIVISSIIVLIISGLATFEIKKNIASNSKTGANTSIAANDTNTGEKTSTAASNSNTGANTSTAANDSNTGSKTSAAVNSTNTGAKTSTAASNSKTGTNTSTAVNSSKTGTKTSTAASSTKTGTNTSTTGSNTNTGSKTTPKVTPTPVPTTPKVTYAAFTGYTWSQSDPRHHHRAGEFGDISQFNSLISGKSTVTSINGYIFSAVKALSKGYDADYIKTKFINKLVDSKYLITDFQVTYYKTPATRTDGWEKSLSEIFDNFKSQGIDNLPGGLFSVGAGYYKTFEDTDNYGGVRLIVKYRRI